MPCKNSVLGKETRVLWLSNYMYVIFLFAGTSKFLPVPDSGR